MVWAELRVKIRDYQHRGGDYLFWARQFEQHADEHRPAGPGKRAPCLTCDQVWPCPTIANDLSPG
ncbi:hypothetical protein GCM10023321_08170 [Pseudonocardia eucalypti]|uniref:4Fe-4S Wbl-type domain-containing protein n=1 Tax=Pseudonocardia eucalypti TaxID=648755 RepID=A0ABP9PJ44_9PSEU